MSAHDIAVDGALVVCVANGLVAVYGGVCWLRYSPSREFWVGLRLAQALALAYAVLVGALVVGNHRPSNSLYYLYALLPIVIGFVAEQLRVVAADQVLGAREIEKAAQVAALPEAEQQSIVLTIMRRELGVMSLAAVVVCFLALRAAGTY